MRNQKLITTRVAQLYVRETQDRVCSASDVGTVALPLIIQRRRAGYRRAEDDTLARISKLAQRLEDEVDVCLKFVTPHLHDPSGDARIAVEVSRISYVRVGSCIDAGR